MTPTHPPAQNFDEMDPHGYGAGHKHHGHHIISGFVLKTVLLVLLVLTILTVGQAQLEQYIVGNFEVDLPRWVNVAVVMAIAVVKGCLVALFFMGLRYDNPMNAVVLCFTLFALGLFLGFTMGDLGARGVLYSYKKGEIVHGGIGNITRTINGEIDTVPGGTPMTEHVRKKKIEQIAARIKAENPSAEDGAIQSLALAEYDRLKLIFTSHGHHDDHDHAEVNTAQRSRLRSGATHGLFDAANPAGSEAHGHGSAASPGHGHDDKASDSKTPEKSSERSGH